MCSEKVVIIGSGLGGLSCGVILAKNGYDVTVVEQNIQPGGCLQCFTRRGAKFETGMHFIGSASQGETLDRLLRYLEVRPEVELSQLDTAGYDVVALGGEQYKFPNGREAFLDQMSTYFPSQADNLVRYYDLVKRVAGASSLHSLKDAESDAAIKTEYQLRAIDDVMGEVINDPHLANVLVGNLPLYAGEKGKTPFATHAFIMNFYNQSSYRVVGGSDAIAKSLCKTLERYGGKVLMNHKATAIVCDDTHATGVEVNGSKMLPAHYVISDAHPIRTLELIDSKLIRPVFRRRVNEMAQTVGGFSVYLQFKENSVPYMNHNYYAYNGNTPWGCEHYDESSWPKGFLYMHFCHCHRPQFAKAGVVLSYMQMSDVEQWIGTKVGRRGNDYEAFKQRKAQQLIASLEKHFPGIGANIEHYYTSTPLTYLDYTGTAGGSMYGIAKDVTQGASGRVPHRMKVPNVFQTGQNINSHGILGVLVGTIVTCSEFLTAQKIYQQITSNQ